MRRLIVLLLVVFTAFTGMAAAADGDNPTVIRESYVESKAQIEKMQAELAELETKVEQTACELDQQQNSMMLSRQSRRRFWKRLIKRLRSVPILKKSLLPEVNPQRFTAGGLKNNLPS